MLIEIDKNSGFCFGVINAINKAEQELNKNNSLFCLGEIVHNNAEVNRLSDKGMQTIKHDSLKNLSGEKVLIRAHGEPPSTFQIAQQNKVHIIDATCPVVLRLQKKIRDSYHNMCGQKGQIVIYGKKGHAEVNGLVGQTNDQAIVVASSEDIALINFSLPVCLFSQTTMDKKQYAEVADKIRKRMQGAMQTEDVPLEVNQTICGSVANRVPLLRKFALEHDVVIFVAGRDSSNGKVLFEVCKSENERTYFVSNPDELQKEWFNENDKIGICGATSTPAWQMDSVSDTIQEMFR